MLCLVTVCSEFEALGKSSLITEGFTIVEMIRKNSKRKNIISFNEAVYTSEVRDFFLSIFICNYSLESRMAFITGVRERSILFTKPSIWVFK